jgi:hypothetical protein
VLGDLDALSRQNTGIEHTHETGVLESMRDSRGDVRGALRILEQQGHARQDARGRWAITHSGRDAADAAEHARGDGQGGGPR